MHVRRITLVLEFHFKVKSTNVPWMGTVFHGFLTILAPFISIFHDFHVARSLNGVPRFSHSLKSLSTQLAASIKKVKMKRKKSFKNSTTP